MLEPGLGTIQKPVRYITGAKEEFHFQEIWISGQVSFLQIRNIITIFVQ